MSSYYERKELYSASDQDHLNRVWPPEKRSIEELKILKRMGAKQPSDLCLEAVREDGMALQYVKRQTNEICLAAVESNGAALMYVKKQTPEICLAAVKNDADMLSHIYPTDRTPEICKAAVNNFAGALRYVPDITPDIYMIAFKKDPTMLCFVPKDKQTDEMCLAAVQLGGRALSQVARQTPEICMAAVKQDGKALRFVEEQTREICIAAVQQNREALKHVKDQTAEICMAAVQADGMALEFVKKQNEQVCLAAVQQNGQALPLVNRPNEKICRTAVRQDGLALQFVDRQTPEICMEAVKQNGFALKYVKDQTPEICNAATEQNPNAVQFMEGKETGKQGKGISLLDMRRGEQYKALSELPARDLCEMVRQHFESHPTLAGEKALKEQVNALLSNMDGDDLALNDMDKYAIAAKYADTRIREVPLKEEGNNCLSHNFKRNDGRSICVRSIDSYEQGNSTVYVDRMDVELRADKEGVVSVFAEASSGNPIRVGFLPEKFLKNSPMNVDSCRAEIQLTDFSNGTRKNMSGKVIVDTDLMSGDALELEADFLPGLEQGDALGK